MTTNTASDMAPPSHEYVFGLLSNTAADIPTSSYQEIGSRCPNFLSKISSSSFFSKSVYDCTNMVGDLQTYCSKYEPCVTIHTAKDVLPSCHECAFFVAILHIELEMF